MPRVLAALYGGPVPSTLIQCVNMKTIDRDLDLFVRHEVGPRLGERVGDGVLLERPPTRVLVAVDREKKFATRGGQRQIRETLVQRLLESLPRDLRSEESRRELDTLVEVTDWGRLPWEFANFTDPQLADAIAASVPLPPGLSRRDLVDALNSERAVRGRNPNVERICLAWPHRFRKVALAEALWPCLEAKIARATRSGQFQRLPATRVAMRALTAAATSHRRSVWLRVQ